jgi:hypothetical protein
MQGMQTRGYIFITSASINIKLTPKCIIELKKAHL